MAPSAGQLAAVVVHDAKVIAAVVPEPPPAAQPSPAVVPRTPPAARPLPKTPVSLPPSPKPLNLLPPPETPLTGDAFRTFPRDVPAIGFDGHEGPGGRDGDKWDILRKQMESACRQADATRAGESGTAAASGIAGQVQEQHKAHAQKLQETIRTGEVSDYSATNSSGAGRSKRRTSPNSCAATTTGKSSACVGHSRS